MLPPKDLNTHCARCKTEILGDEALCRNCGAVLELEVKIAVQSTLAMQSLRKWLVIVALLVSAQLFALYVHFGGLPWLSMAPGLAVVATFVAFAALARRFLMLASLVPAAIFVSEWVWSAWRGDVTVFGSVLHILSAIILADAVRAAFRVRALRRKSSNLPSATVRMVQNSE